MRYSSSFTHSILPPDIARSSPPPSPTRRRAVLLRSLGSIGSIHAGKKTTICDAYHRIRRGSPLDLDTHTNITFFLTFVSLPCDYSTVTLACTAAFAAGSTTLLCILFLSGELSWSNHHHHHHGNNNLPLLELMIQPHHHNEDGTNTKEWPRQLRRGTVTTTREYDGDGGDRSPRRIEAQISFNVDATSSIDDSVPSSLSSWPTGVAWLMVCPKCTMHYTNIGNMEYLLFEVLLLITHTTLRNMIASLVDILQSHSQTQEQVTPSMPFES